MDGWMDGLMEGWTDRQTDSQGYILAQFSTSNFKMSPRDITLSEEICACFAFMICSFFM